MTEKPSNETIYALLKEFREETKEHFKTLNRQTSKNTAFRNKAVGGFILIGFLGASILIKLFI